MERERERRDHERNWAEEVPEHYGPERRGHRDYPDRDRDFGPAPRGRDYGPETNPKRIRREQDRRRREDFRDSRYGPRGYR